jgi:DNA-binding CsgD family transcriptional regulator
MYPLGDQDTSAAPACVVVMDAERRLIQASPGARRMLTSCPSLRLIHGVVCASTNAVGAKLAAAVRALVSGEAYERTLRIDECGIDVTMIMVEGITGMRQIVATLRQIAQSRALHLYRAVDRFGLTPAEARLLDILCTGVSIPQAASRLGVARTTARTHLQRIFDKSGVRRQSDLQRLVFAPMPLTASW